MHHLAMHHLAMHLLTMHHLTLHHLAMHHLAHTVLLLVCHRPSLMVNMKIPFISLLLVLDEKFACVRVLPFVCC
jgi:hypothetical protein